LDRLTKFKGIQKVTIDFPLDLRIGPKCAIQGDLFSAEFVKEAGKAGVALAFSIYPNGPGKWWQRLRSPVAPEKNRKRPNHRK
jgi:hypothetical protein